MLKVSFQKQYEKYGLLTPQHTAEDLIANGVTTADKREAVADRLSATGVAAQGWISVKDRLPDINVIVLATLREPEKRLNHPYGEKILLLCRTKSNCVHGTVTKWERPYGAETIDYDDVVTHWMPLPPPEGVT